MEAIWAGAGAAITALFAGLVVLMQGWHKARMENRATALAQLEAIVDRLQAQAARDQRQSAAQQAAIRRLYEMQSECREMAAQQYADLKIMHAVCTRLTQCVRDLGGKAVDVPELKPPAPRPHDPRDDPEFILRSAEQDDLLVRQARQAVPPGAPVPGPGPGLIP